MKPKRPAKKYGNLTAPVQFERWCSLYLASSTERNVYNEEARRLWARRATQHIMRRFTIPAIPRLDGDA